MASEANNVKFNFLQPTDPYHAYYRMRVRARFLKQQQQQQGGAWGVLQQQLQQGLGSSGGRSHSSCS